MCSSVARGARGYGGGSRGGEPCPKCTSDYNFASYFDLDQGAVNFPTVHKVFGASNVSKMFNSIPNEKHAVSVIIVLDESHTGLCDPLCL
jgi:hypothetical protein